MTLEIWNKLDEFFAKYPILRATSVGMGEVKKAIGVDVDSYYLEFVSRYGGAIVGPYPIYGLRYAEAMEKQTVLEVTQHYRKQNWRGVEEWLIISSDHAGNPFGLDSKGSVWISDHDFGEVKKIANSFEEFILWCLNRK
jgi:SMI1-KNR4 cell-wall